jgi:hypothetical protein
MGPGGGVGAGGSGSPAGGSGLAGTPADGGFGRSGGWDGWQWARRGSVGAVAIARVFGGGGGARWVPSRDAGGGTAAWRIGRGAAIGDLQGGIDAVRIVPHVDHPLLHLFYISPPCFITKVHATIVRI